MFIGVAALPRLAAQSIDSSAEAALRSTMAERHVASLEGDTQKIASSMTDDYLQTDISGVVQSKEIWLKNYFIPLAQLIKAGKFRWEVYDEKDVQVRIHGDTGVVIGTLEAKGSGARFDVEQHTWVSDPNARFSGKLHFTRVYIRQDGKWFLAALQNAVPISPTTASKQSSAVTVQPAPEIQKLAKAFLGTWSVTEKIEPSQTMPNGGDGRGEEVYRLGPGGHSFIEEIHLNEPTKEISGAGVAWWDDKAKGYRAVWCDGENPSGCILMAHLAKWEGDQFVLGDESERNGRKFEFKEVFSEITPSSFTQTLYQGEAGKELKRLLTIHATKKSK
jgi:hypothetical protein